MGNGRTLDRLPKPGEKRIALRVTPAAERSLRQAHPWLFEKSIASQSHTGGPGDIAVVFDRKGRFLAVGLYDPASPIRVRLLQHQQAAAIDVPFFIQRLQAASDRRPTLPCPGTNGFRLIHGENDGLPGLVIDRYAQTLVVKLYSWAWIPHLKSMVEAIEALLRPERLVLRLSRQTVRLLDPAWGLADGMLLCGSPLTGPVHFEENGLHFLADVQHGQKSGFFLDQRDNRQRVEQLVDGGEVLNVFAYTGGFSLYAARGGAASVLSLDISAPALALAEENFLANQEETNIASARHTTQVADAFAAMGGLVQERRSFDMVILDPPSFAKQRSEIDGALQAYARLARLGLALVRPNGRLVFASCSSRIPADAFFDMISTTATSAGRTIREIERTGHAIDHPIAFREGAYLKCLFAEVQ